MPPPNPPGEQPVFLKENAFILHTWSCDKAATPSVCLHDVSLAWLQQRRLQRSESTSHTQNYLTVHEPQVRFFPEWLVHLKTPRALTGVVDAYRPDTP